MTLTLEKYADLPENWKKAATAWKFEKILEATLVVYVLNKV